MLRLRLKIEDNTQEITVKSTKSFARVTESLAESG